MPEYGLTDLGRQQAKEAGTSLMNRTSKRSQTGTFFYTSPFSRALQTAQIASEAFSLPADNFIVRDELRERFFGTDIELQSDRNYNRIWARDVVNLDFHDSSDIESIQDVSNRLRLLVEELEEKHRGCDLVLVAHGDVISVLRVFFEGVELNAFREFGTSNCEICKYPSSFTEST